MKNNATRAIYLKDVYVRYNRLQDYVLRKISFSIDKGVFVIVTGANASGKTTLIRLLTGLIPGFYKAYVSGLVKVLDIDPVNDQEKLVGKIGYLSQEPFSQILTPFVYEEVALSLILSRNIHSREELHNYVIKALDLLGSRHLINRSTFELSGGEVVRVVLASNISCRPEILFLDEPTAFLDTNAIRDLYDSLAFLKKQGITIFVATHRPEDFAGLIDVEIRLNNGVIEYFGKPRITCSRKKLATDIFQFFKKASEPALCSMSSCKIKVFNATYSYPRKGFSLNNISLCVNEHEKTLLLGPNGSGKTTLLKLLAGIYKPHKGIVSRKGKAIYVPQDPRIFFTYETPFHEFLNRGFTRDEIIALANLFGFKDFLFNPIHTLSYGTLRKISVLIGVYGDYDIVLLDEPSAGVDKESLHELAKIICSSDKTIIVATNDLKLLDLIVKCFDKIVVVKNGKIDGVYYVP